MNENKKNNKNYMKSNKKPTINLFKKVFKVFLIKE